MRDSSPCFRFVVVFLVLIVGAAGACAQKPAPVAYPDVEQAPGEDWLTGLGFSSGHDYDVKYGVSGGGSVSILEDSVGNIESFWNVDDGIWRSTNAILVNKTENAYIYVQTKDPCNNDVWYDGGSYNGYITQEDANQLAAEFDAASSTDDIYGRDRAVFGAERPTGADGDARVTVLLMDIDGDHCDGYAGGGYVAGYYHSVNEGTGTYSNQRKMVYMDTFPAVENGDWSTWDPTTDHNDSPYAEGMRDAVYGTLAHEFQHLIHWYYDADESTWLNEGCSDFAQYINGYGDPESHLSYFQDAPDTNLVTWSGSLADYGASYLFTLYLWEHYGGNDTISALVNDSTNSMSSVSNVLAARGYAAAFESVFRDWVVANFLDNTSVADGRYGYDSTDTSMAISSTKTAYPASGSGSVNTWATDYVRFTAGNGSNLNVSFNGANANDFAARLMRTDAANPSAVANVSLEANEDGSRVTNSFGDYYDDVYLVIAGLARGGSYSYQAAYTSAQDSDDTPPSANPYAPADGAVANTTPVNLTCSASDETALANISLWGNFSGAWAREDSADVSGKSNQSDFSVALADGMYRWSCSTCDAAGNCAFASDNRTMNVSVPGDQQPPTVILNDPADEAVVEPGMAVFSFHVTEDVALANCSLWGNFTGAWARNATNDSALVNGSADNFSLALSSGEYVWNVECADNSSNSAYATANRSLVVNAPPSLSNGTVTPDSGNWSTLFTFSVAYTDADGGLPAYVNVSYRNQTHAMDETFPADGDTADGKAYHYVTALPGGNVSYEFIGSDDINETSTAPANVSVTAAPPWNVSGLSGNCTNEALTVTENITVYSGLFFLDNCTLSFDSGTAGAVGLDLRQGAYVDIADSTIRAANEPYYFTTAANLAVSDTAIVGAHTVTVSNGSATFTNVSFVNASTYGLTYAGYPPYVDYSSVAAANSFAGNALGWLARRWDVAVSVADGGLPIAGAQVNASDAVGGSSGNQTNASGETGFTLTGYVINNSGGYVAQTPHNISVSAYVFSNWTAATVNASMNVSIELTMTPLINEVAPNDNVTGDWIELFNPRLVSVNLTGWAIGHANPPENTSFSDADVIEVGGYLLVNESVLGFGFNDANDTLFLYDEGGSLIDSYAYLDGGEVAENVSYDAAVVSSIGRVTDGAVEWTVFVNPSPNSRNIDILESSYTFSAGWNLIALQVTP